MLPNAKTRLTIMVPDSVHHRLKVIAAESRTSMKALVESAIKNHVLGTHPPGNNHQQARG